MKDRAQRQRVADGDRRFIQLAAPAQRFLNDRILSESDKFQRLSLLQIQLKRKSASCAGVDQDGEWPH